MSLKRIFIFAALSFFISNSFAGGVDAASKTKVTDDNAHRIFKPSDQAYWQGFYIGLQGGYSSVDYSSLNYGTNTIGSFDDTGVAPQVEVGYNYNPYIAAELAVDYLHKPKLGNINGTGQTGKFKNNVVYFVAKVFLPIKTLFRVYAKAGIGYIPRDAVKVNGVNILSSGEFIRPVYGVGATYRIAQDWEFETSWVQASKNTDHSLPASNFFGVGANYWFIW